MKTKDILQYLHGMTVNNHPMVYLEEIEELLSKEENEGQDSFRKLAAIAAMHAIISNDMLRNAKMEAAANIKESPLREIAQSAIRYADALMEELSKED